MDSAPEEYKKGYADFLGCKIGLSRQVLIPRPETEFWTRQAIGGLKKIKRPLRILDIFSGSGCVGIAVAKRLPQAVVDFGEIDPEAVKQIKINLNTNGIEKGRAEIFQSDIFKDIPAENRYDAILANPPYVDPARAGEVQRSVLDYEPHGALFGGERGTDIIDKFLKDVKDYLKPEGIVYLEFDPRQLPEIKKILTRERFSSFGFFKDQFGLWRFVRAIK